MCGRFENKRIEKALLEMFRQLDIDLIIEEGEKKYKEENIAPTDKINSVHHTEENYILKKIKWGIKFKEDSPLIFNSRIETIKGKKYWQSLFNKNKCIVPMSGFYEWKKEGTRKVPYKIFLPDKPIFFVPALYMMDKEKNIFASLVTTEPNKFIKPIHHRMPVIFDIKEAVSFMNNDIEKNL